MCRTMKYGRYAVKCRSCGVYIDEDFGEQKLQQLKSSSQLEITLGNKGLGRRSKYR